MRKGRARIRAVLFSTIALSLVVAVGIMGGFTVAGLAAHSEKAPRMHAAVAIRQSGQVNIGTSVSTRYVLIGGIPYIIVTQISVTKKGFWSDPTWTATVYETEYNIIHQELWRLTVIESWYTDSATNTITGYQNPPNVVPYVAMGPWTVSNVKGSTSVLNPSQEIEASGQATFTETYFGFTTAVDTAYVNIFCYGNGGYTYSANVN